MTDKEAADIAARAEAATPGPWVVDKRAGWAVDAPGRHFSARLGTGSLDGAWPTKEIDADATFIAHAREDIPALLAKVEQLRAENDALREVVEGVAALKDEFYGKTVDDVKIGGWAFATEDVTPLVEQARMLLGIDEEETDHP